MNDLREMETNGDVKKKKSEYAFYDRIYRTALYRAAEFALEFGAPAVIAVYAGKKLGVWYGRETAITLLLLGAAFIVSWVIVYSRCRQISRAFREARKEAERADEGSIDTREKDTN